MQGWAGLEKMMQTLGFSKSVNILTNSSHCTFSCSIWLYKAQHIHIAPSMKTCIMSLYPSIISLSLDRRLYYIPCACLKLHQIHSICYTIFYNKLCGIRKLQKVEQRLLCSRLTDINARSSYFTSFCNGSLSTLTHWS